MATCSGPSIALAIGLSLTAILPVRAQGQTGGFDEVKNTFGLCRVQLRNLASAVRARLDDVEAGWGRSSEMRRRLMDQQIATQKALGAYEQARLKVEVAEVMVLEYEHGTSKQQLEAIERDIAMARADQKRAEDRSESAQKDVEETKALVERIGQMPKERIGDLMSEYYASQNRRSAENQLQSARLAIDKAKFTLEQAETSKTVFLKFTREKTLKELKAEVEGARADMLMKQLEKDLARDAERRIEREARDVEDRARTRGEAAAMTKFAALESPWKAILARRGEIEKGDPAKRDELKKLLDDFARALNEADAAWSSAREARFDDRDAATMRRAR